MFLSCKMGLVLKMDESKKQTVLHAQSGSGDGPKCSLPFIEGLRVALLEGRRLRGEQGEQSPHPAGHSVQ